MGRRHIPTYHALTGEQRIVTPYSGAEPRAEKEQFCGDWSAYGHYDWHHPLLDATCRDCGRAWGKAERAKVADRITVEKLTLSGLKSAVIVSVDGVKRAVVYMRNGWGECWNVQKYREDNINRGYGFYGGIGGDMESNVHRKKEDAAKPASEMPVGVYNIHKSAMDAMIAIVPALVEAGLLPTEEEEKAADEAKKAERLRADQAREAAIQKNREDRNHAKEALKQIEDRARELGLSNFEVEGLALALKML